MRPSDQETTRGPVRPRGGGSNPEEKPYLLGVSGEHKGRLFPLEGLREVVIGRTGDCEITHALDRGVSRRHARVSLDSVGRAWVEDLGSMNGTLVNGNEVHEATPLGRGDRIFVGDSCILKMDWLTPAEVEQWMSATIDALTECLNRAMFDSRLQDLATLAIAGSRTLGLLVIDVDRFKSVNDEHNHQVGDYVLQRVAETIRATLGNAPGGLAAYRFGGEEFAVLVPDTRLEGAVQIAEAIRREIEALRLVYQDLRLQVTVSIGVAVASPGEGSEPTTPTALGEKLLLDADTQMYRAKHEGRNRVCS